MSASEKEIGEAVIAMLVMVLREGQARSKPGELTVIKAHVQTVVAETVKRLNGRASRADVLEVWLMLQLRLALDAQGQQGEQVPQSTVEA